MNRLLAGDECRYAGCGRAPETVLFWRDTGERTPACAGHALRALERYPKRVVDIDPRER